MIFAYVGVWVAEIGPRFISSLTFFPCGMLLGYTIHSAFLNNGQDNIVNWKTNGPLILGAISSIFCALLLFLFKIMNNKVVFCHFEIFIAAMVCNILGSIFFFIDNLDFVGACFLWIAYGLTFVAALSYLLIISSKNLRTLLLTSCFTWFLIGLSSAVSVIQINWVEVEINVTNNDSYDTSGVYHGFGGLHMGASFIILIVLILIKLFHYLGNLDYKMIYDKELNICNSNETIFETKSEVIKRIPFFYITRGRQWITTFILIFCDAIHFSLFFYFLCWLSLNKSIQLTKESSFEILLWTVFVGSIALKIAIFFISIKIIFIATTLLQIGLVLLGMVIYKISLIPFWLVCVLFGISFSNIKILILEIAQIKYLELIICSCYLLKLSAIAVINISFISADMKHSIFYREDSLISHGLAFVTIMSLISIIISNIPRTFKTSLFEIQYSMWGIIFKDHQIEAMNMQVLTNGTIPTITRNT